MKQTRKKVALSLVVMGCLGLFSAPPVQAFSVFGIGAPSSETVASKILETLTKMGGSKFCLKGKNVSPFTIRSFEGYAGKVKILAAAGELACRPKNVPDYLDSHFHKNAVATLGTDDLVKIKAIYVAEVRAAKGNALKLGCTVAKMGLLDSGVGAPAVPLVSAACSAVK